HPLSQLFRRPGPFGFVRRSPRSGARRRSRLLTGGLLVRIQPEEPISTMSWSDFERSGSSVPFLPLKSQEIGAISERRVLENPFKTRMVGGCETMAEKRLRHLVSDRPSWITQAGLR